MQSTDHVQTGAAPRIAFGRQLTWTLPGTMISAACQCLTLVVLARWGTPAQVGQFGLALAVTAPAFMLAQLRLRTVLATDSRNLHSFREYLAVRLVGVAVALGCVGLFVLLSASTGETANLVLLMALAKGSESISDIFRGLQQKYERLDRVSISLSADGLLTLCCFSLLFRQTGQVLWAVGGLLLARVLVLALYDMPAANSLRRKQMRELGSTVQSPARLRPRRLAALFWHALPLGLTALLVSLNSNTPKYLLAYFQGDHELGIFCTLAAVMAAGTMAFRAVEQPSSPRLAIYFQHQRRAFWRLLKTLIAMFTVVGVITVLLSVLFGRLLLTRLLAPEYGPYADVLALMMLATTAAQVAGILETSLICARWTRVQLPMHGCTMLLCLALGCLLIPRTGAQGAAVAISVCRLPYIILAIILLRRIAPVGEPATRQGHPVETRLLTETSHCT